MNSKAARTPDAKVAVRYEAKPRYGQDKERPLIQLRELNAEGGKLQRDERNFDQPDSKGAKAK